MEVWLNKSLMTNLLYSAENLLVWFIYFLFYEHFHLRSYCSLHLQYFLLIYLVAYLLGVTEKCWWYPIQTVLTIFYLDNFSQLSIGFRVLISIHQVIISMKFPYKSCDLLLTLLFRLSNLLTECFCYINSEWVSAQGIYVC